MPARKRPPPKKGLMYSNRYPVVPIGLRRRCAGGLILGSTSLLKVVILMRKKGNSRKKKWTVMKWQRIWRKIQTRLWKVMVSMMNWKKKCGRVLTYAFQSAAGSNKMALQKKVDLAQKTPKYQLISKQIISKEFIPRKKKCFFLRRKWTKRWLPINVFGELPKRVSEKLTKKSSRVSET